MIERVDDFTSYVAGVRRGTLNDPQSLSPRVFGLSLEEVMVRSGGAR